jgi:hypothetical protein
VKKTLTLILLLSTFAAKAQKVDSIYFNLYTDSLKKGVHNYINVDGKYSNGIYQPLMTDEIILSSSAGKWEGNSLLIDSTYKCDSVVITAKLKSTPSIFKTVTIYIKRFEVEELLPTEQEVLEGIRNSRKKKNFTAIQQESLR